VTDSEVSRNEGDSLKEVATTTANHKGAREDRCRAPGAAGKCLPIAPPLNPHLYSPGWMRLVDSAWGWPG
jgi:hypothetical protein